jgi:hypothetical protein
MIDLTTYLREIIQRNGLVNSGRLLNSTTVNLSVSGNVLFINIRTVDYFMLLNERFKLLEQLTNNSSFNKEIEKIFEKNIEDALQNSRVKIIENIKMKITF